MCPPFLYGAFVLHRYLSIYQLGLQAHSIPFLCFAVFWCPHTFSHEVECVSENNIKISKLCCMREFSSFLIFVYVCRQAWCLPSSPHLHPSIQRSPSESVISFIMTFFISTKTSFSLPLVYCKTIVLDDESHG